MGLGEQVILSDKKSKRGQWTMNILIIRLVPSMTDRKIYIVNIRVIANRMQKVKWVDAMVNRRDMVCRKHWMTY